MTNPILFRGEPTDPKDLRDVVGQAMGAASSCWENLGGTGLFQADRAAAILTEAMEWINANFEPVSYEPIPVLDEDGSVVLAANRWPSNAELIADCAKLGYLRDDWLTLDPTYGRGVWWKRWRPNVLVTHNRDKDGVDYRALPHADATFDAVTYDPSYVSTGGRKTTTIPEFNERYGLTTAASTPAGVQAEINDGLDEMVRVLKSCGSLLVKCQDYVSSGQLWPGTHYTLTHALSLGCDLVDRMEHIGTPRPQPKRTRKDGEPVLQQHARRNLSTLLVLRGPKKTIEEAVPGRGTVSGYQVPRV